MKRLVICIELLVGYYFISIDNNHIFTTYSSFDSEEVKFVSLIDIHSNTKYKFNGLNLVPLVPLENPPVNLSIIESKKVETDLELNGFKCDKYHATYDLMFIANAPNSQQFEEEKYLSTIELIDRYIVSNELKSDLIFIGNDYKTYKQYIVESNKINHSTEDKSLVHRISDIYETNKVDSVLLEILSSSKLEP